MGLEQWPITRANRLRLIELMRKRPPRNARAIVRLISPTLALLRVEHQDDDTLVTTCRWLDPNDRANRPTMTLYVKIDSATGQAVMSLLEQGAANG